MWHVVQRSESTKRHFIRFSPDLFTKKYTNPLKSTTPNSVFVSQAIHVFSFKNLSNEVWIFFTKISRKIVCVFNKNEKKITRDVRTNAVPKQSKDKQRKKFRYKIYVGRYIHHQKSNFLRLEEIIIHPPPPPENWLLDLNCL